MMKKKAVKILLSTVGITTAICIGFGAIGCGAQHKSDSEAGSYRTTAKSDSRSTNSVAYEEAACEEVSYAETTYAYSDYVDYAMEAECNTILLDEASTPMSAPSSASSGSFYEPKAEAENTAEVATEEFEWDTTSYTGSTTPTVNTIDRKLIKNVSLTVETLTFDDFLASLQDRIFVYGGYVEAMETWNNARNSKKSTTRDASMTIRIPSAQLGSFVAELGDNCNVLSRNESVNDVTGSYTDFESRKKVLKMEEERLLGFMAEAETMEDILVLEGRLTEIQTEIDRIESTLRTYDNQVAYSTIRLRVNEVVELTPEPEEEPEEEPTFFENIAENFMMTIENILEGAELFAYWLARNIITLVILGVAAIFVTKKVKKIRKNKKLQTAE